MHLTDAASTPVCVKISYHEYLATHYKSFFPRLTHVIIARFGFSEQESEDIVSDIFLRLCEREREFGSEDHLQQLLFKATRNLALDRCRALKRSEQKETEMAQCLSRTLEFEVELQSDYSALHEKAMNAFANVPIRSKAVLDNYYLKGRKAREIAAQFGIKHSTVLNHCTAGLNHIRQQIGFLQEYQTCHKKKPWYGWEQDFHYKNKAFVRKILLHKRKRYRFVHPAIVTRFGLYNVFRFTFHHRLGSVLDACKI